MIFSGSESRSRIVRSGSFSARADRSASVRPHHGRAQTSKPGHPVTQMQNGTSERDQIVDVLLLLQLIDFNRLVTYVRIAEGRKNFRDMRSASHENRNLAPVARSLD